MEIGKTTEKLIQKINQLKFKVDRLTGHLFYEKDFVPLTLNNRIIFVRHGETFGNCGQSTREGVIDKEAVSMSKKDHTKRIFQGNVDDEINQLTSDGKKAAIKVAESLMLYSKEKDFKPDLILHSPLRRAYETGLPFVEMNGNANIYLRDPLLTEISFGAWENKRVCDFSHEDDCHLFYKSQNTLVHGGGVDKEGNHCFAESFIEVLLRAHLFLHTLNDRYQHKNIILFSHSMFGAACFILLGRGNIVEEGGFLAFDGQRKDGSKYTIPHTTPLIMA